MKKVKRFEDYVNNPTWDGSSGLPEVAKAMLNDLAEHIERLEERMDKHIDLDSNQAH